MERKEVLEVVFFETANNRQPVRDFILSLDQNDRKIVGSDIFVVQKTFPLGLPLVRKINANYRSSGFNLAEDIVKGTSVLGLLRIANYIEKKDNLKAILQSYTTAFNFDEEYNKNYSDGSQNDDLIKIAQNAFEKFDNEKYNN